MINLRTGEFRLDQPSLIIHPELTLSDFRSSGVKPEAERHTEATGFTTVSFFGELDDLEAWFLVFFREERIHQFHFGQAAMEKSKESISPDAEEAQKHRHDIWLGRVTGAS